MTAPATPRKPGAAAADARADIAVRAVLRSPTRSAANRSRARQIAWKWVATRWPRLVPPPAAREQQALACSAPGVKLSVATSRDQTVWVLEVAQDERGSQRCWTTRAVVADMGDADVLAVETTCSALDSAPVVAPPRLLGEWVQRLHVEDAGVAVTAEPSVVDLDQLPGFTQHLCSSERRLPLLVLSNKPGTRYFGTDPRALAESAQGLAHVVCLTPEAASALVASYGRRLGPVAGAARIYLPGFQETDASSAHPLVHPPARHLSDGTEVQGHATAFRRSLCRRLCAISGRADAAQLPSAPASIPG